MHGDQVASILVEGVLLVALVHELLNVGGDVAQDDGLAHLAVGLLRVGHAVVVGGHQDAVVVRRGLFGRVHVAPLVAGRLNLLSVRVRRDFFIAVSCGCLCSLKPNSISIFHFPRPFTGTIF